MVPRRVLITGVSRGLGRALARTMATRGHIVLGCARTESAVADLQRELGSPHAIAVVDVRNADGVAGWLADQLAVGVPDLAILSAGMANTVAPLWNVPHVELRDVVTTAVEGTANFIRVLAPAMISAGTGVMVAMSSGLGRSAARGMAPYCASKWALEGMMRALALDLPKGLASVTFDPGMVRTDMLERYLPRAADSYWGADEWAPTAADLLLGLDASANGQALSLGRHTRSPAGGLVARAASTLRRHR